MSDSLIPEARRCVQEEASLRGGEVSTDGLRAVRVGDEIFHCPSFVQRVRHGWQLRFKRIPSVYFADSTYGSPGASLRAAEAARAQQLPTVDAMRRAAAETPRKRSLGQHEQDRKVLKTGVVGVHLSMRPGRRGSTTSYTLTISCPGQKSRSLYVGTESTLQARLPAKLKEATTLREQWVAQRPASKALRRRDRAPAAEASVRASTPNLR